MASSLMRVLPGCMLAKYLTSLSKSICRATNVCSRASWCELAECRKYSIGDNTNIKTSLHHKLCKYECDRFPGLWVSGLCQITSTPRTFILSKTKRSFNSICLIPDVHKYVWISALSSPFYIHSLHTCTPLKSKSIVWHWPRSIRLWRRVLASSTRTLGTGSDASCSRGASRCSENWSNDTQSSSIAS